MESTPITYLALTKIEVLKKMAAYFQAQKMPLDELKNLLAKVQSSSLINGHTELPNDLLLSKATLEYAYLLKSSFAISKDRVATYQATETTRNSFVICGFHDQAANTVYFIKGGLSQKAIAETCDNWGDKLEAFLATTKNSGSGKSKLAALQDMALEVDLDALLLADIADPETDA